MCETGQGSVCDFETPTEGGEEFDALVDLICAEARAQRERLGQPEPPDSPVSRPCATDSTDKTPPPVGTPPRLASVTRHAHAVRTPRKAPAPLIAKCARGFRLLTDDFFAKGAQKRKRPPGRKYKEH
jgi:hypothetical protein